jgi:hypothetical protein
MQTPSNGDSSAVDRVVGMFRSNRHWTSIIRFRQTGGGNLRGLAMHKLWCASLRTSHFAAS